MLSLIQLAAEAFQQYYSRCYHSVIDLITIFSVCFPRRSLVYKSTERNEKKESSKLQCGGGEIFFRDIKVIQSNELDLNLLR